MTTKHAQISCNQTIASTHKLSQTSCLSPSHKKFKHTKSHFQAQNFRNQKPKHKLPKHKFRKSVNKSFGQIESSQLKTQNQNSSAKSQKSVTFKNFSTLKFQHQVFNGLIAFHVRNDRTTHVEHDEHRFKSK